MTVQFFLYRRLARWITCELNFQNNSKIKLQNKYEIASFKDVFCHPFYWQVFNWVQEPPKLIVDCGAHCGHFTILADLCFQSKFNTLDTKYVLIEPNPYLLQVLQKNVLDNNLFRRADVRQGLLGKKIGTNTLWINQKNYLTASLNPEKGLKPHTVNYLDLSKIVGSQTIDLLKIDIEGGEFEFIRSNPELLSQVNLVFMELHKASEEAHKDIFESFKSAGLNLVAPPIQSNGQQLVILQR